MAEAEAIVCTGLVDDRNETVADYRALIEEGVARALPFVCANPDLVVDVGAVQLFVCRQPSPPSTSGSAGRCSGPASRIPPPTGRRWRARPSCAGRAAELTRILAIGDAVRTDLAAAHGLGVDGLFIASGIHKGEVMAAGEIDPARLARAVRPARHARRPSPP